MLKRCVNFLIVERLNLFKFLISNWSRGLTIEFITDGCSRIYRLFFIEYSFMGVNIHLNLHTHLHLSVKRKIPWTYVFYCLLCRFILLSCFLWKEMKNSLCYCFTGFCGSLSSCFNGIHGIVYVRQLST